MKKSINPRTKGKRFEYEVRDLFRSLGFEAERVPLSGASRALKGDVIVSRGGLQFSVECKRRKKLPFFASLASPSQVVALRGDRGEVVFIVSKEFMEVILNGPSSGEGEHSNR